jgi:hypothetical protein
MKVGADIIVKIKDSAIFSNYLSFKNAWIKLSLAKM